jgi:acetyltransferase-like isoleucine patch superfamily enzyme
MIGKKIYSFITKNKIRYYKRKGIDLGENCKISPQSYIDCHRPNKNVKLIKIGNNVRISRWAMILSTDIEITEDPSVLWEKRNLTFKKTVIGNNVFIGTQVIILPGSTIGNNVIIGANSVVKGKIPSNSVAVGSPARVIKTIPVKNIPKVN